MRPGDMSAWLGQPQRLVVRSPNYLEGSARLDLDLNVGFADKGVKNLYSLLMPGSCDDR